MLIPQLIPTITKESKLLVDKMFEDPTLFNGNTYSTLCENWLSQNMFNNKPVFLTTSGTRALELIATAIDIKQNDEIIFPSYTFVGTANPFVLFGATPVFVDVIEESIGLDHELLEQAITPKTKAIVVVHYNGIGVHIDKLVAIAKKHNILLIEDNAQGFMCKYDDKYLGTFADFSILSFNYTKNVQCGEGGALIINNSKYVGPIEKIYHLGTNRLDFVNKKVSHYEWVCKGSKFYPSQLEAAVLFPQLEKSSEILGKRKKSWKLYFNLLSESTILKKHIDLPVQFQKCEHTGHIFYIKLKDKQDKQALVSNLRDSGIIVFSHYTPLHLSEFGKINGVSYGGEISAKISDSLLRLPIHSQISNCDIQTVVSAIEGFFTI
ncbi:MAG: dTDP-4-amino-4,6-dideoxygalactose transaminase [Urechidicola sp.]|jgi:dTDP-4-amino-4,6-dideoxygalactose transaminase